MTKREFQQAVDAIIDGTGQALRLKRALKARAVPSTVEYEDLFYAYEMVDKASEHLEELLAALQAFSYERNEKSLT